LSEDVRNLPTTPRIFDALKGRVLALSRAIWGSDGFPRAKHLASAYEAAACFKNDMQMSGDLNDLPTVTRTCPNPWPAPQVLSPLRRSKARLGRFKLNHAEVIPRAANIAPETPRGQRGASELEESAAANECFLLCFISAIVTEQWRAIGLARRSSLD